MRRKMMICVLAALMALGLVSGVLADSMMPDNAIPEYDYMYVYTRNGKPLHMRQYPSRDTAVLQDIPYGGRVKMIYEENLTWAYVQYNGISGYVMQEYLVVNKPASINPTPNPDTSLPATTAGDLGTLNSEFKTLRLVNSFTVYSSPTRASGFVNLRFAPHLQAEIATICYDGHALNVIAQTTSWYQVEDPSSGYTGFIMKKFTRTRR